MRALRLKQNCAAVGRTTAAKTIKCPAAESSVGLFLQDINSMYNLFFFFGVVNIKYWLVHFKIRDSRLGRVTADVQLRLRATQTAHLCPSSPHLQPAIRGLCDKHSPWVLNHTSLGPADSAWWIFLGKKGGVISEVTLMWATFIKPRSRGSGWNWKTEKAGDSWRVAGGRRHKVGERGTKQTNSSNAEADDS